MKFKFIGKEDSDFYTNEIYEILQFNRLNKYFVIYVINMNNKMRVIPYRSTDAFNDNWQYVK